LKGSLRKIKLKGPNSSQGVALGYCNSSPLG
jgi:hypothetical protein